MASIVYSPLQWQCSNCNKSYSNSPNITFLRGTCSHDVCTSCITNGASLKRQTTLIEVRCPVDGCRRGTFHVKRSINVTDVASSGRMDVKSEHLKEKEAIDLCSTDDEGDRDRKPAAVVNKGKIKQEIKTEQITSPKRSTSIKKEKTPETITTTSTSNHHSKKIKIVSPLPTRS